MDFIEFLKVLVLGIVEGFTEWLPISSTGHMILVDEIIHLNVTDAFMSMFRVVIQLGAILAVVVLYFRRLNPFDPGKTRAQKVGTVKLWMKIVVACIPAAILGLLLDDWMDAHLYLSLIHISGPGKALLRSALKAWSFLRHFAPPGQSFHFPLSQNPHGTKSHVRPPKRYHP